MFNIENDNLFVVKIEFFFLIYICNRCIVSKKYYVDNKICWVGKKVKIIFFIIVCIIIIEICEILDKMYVLFFKIEILFIIF